MVIQRLVEKQMGSGKEMVYSLTKPEWLSEIKEKLQGKPDNQG